jgi:mannose/fructose/N-acetylgalactosamine-specific phosphotransferase system component IID
MKINAYTVSSLNNKHNYFSPQMKTNMSKLTNMQLFLNWLMYEQDTPELFTTAVMFLLQKLIKTFLAMYGVLSCPIICSVFEQWSTSIMATIS